MRYLKKVLSTVMFIGVDFDGVVVSKQAEKVQTVEEMVRVKPTSEGIVQLLNDNIVQMILTGRKDLVPVLEWCRRYVSGYRGEVATAHAYGGSKKRYLLFRGVDVFVTDEDAWLDDLREWERESGKVLLVFDEERDGCVRDLLLRNQLLLAVPGIVKQL